MVTNRKVTGKASSMPMGLAMGGALSMGVTVLLAMITAKLADTGTVGEEYIGYAAVIILLLSSALGAWLAAAKIKRQRLVVCIASGVIYYGLLVCLTAVFFGGTYVGMGVTALVVAGSNLTVSLLGMGQGRGRKHHIRH